MSENRTEGDSDTIIYFSKLLKKRNSDELLQEITNAVIAGDYDSSRFITRVFDAAPGVWQDVLPLCVESNEITWALSQLEQKKNWPLRVCWIDYPQAIHGVGYGIVVFFFDSTAWGTSIIYRRQEIIDRANAEAMK